LSPVSPIAKDRTSSPALAVVQTGYGDGREMSPSAQTSARAQIAEASSLEQPAAQAIAAIPEGDLVQRQLIVVRNVVAPDEYAALVKLAYAPSEDMLGLVFLEGPSWRRASPLLFLLLLTDGVR
jgi:hypothetical protein